MAKRIFDFILSFCGLIISLPLFILIIFFVWLEDGRPVFYIQERVGKDAKIFKLLKFRTLNENNEIPVFMRLLRQTALDELPQLINILKGQMSFVGPRPLIPNELSSTEKALARLKIKPGLTGMAQVFTSKNATLEEKLDYDLLYGKTQSLWLDFQLILKSFANTVAGKWDI